MVTMQQQQMVAMEFFGAVRLTRQTLQQHSLLPKRIRTTQPLLQTHMQHLYL